MAQIESRSGGEPSSRKVLGSSNPLGSFFEGEQAHSCEEPGGLFAACELGNAPLFGAFPDRARALPREKLSSAARLRESPYFSLLFGGEKALSLQSPGGALTAFELGNGSWSVPFPDRARVPPREKRERKRKQPEQAQAVLKCALRRCGGAKGIRTPDLLNAIQTRYQLRYNPVNMIIQERAHKNQAFLYTNFLQFPFRPRSSSTTGLLPHSSSGRTRPGSAPPTPLLLPKPLHEERQRNV